MSNENKYLQGNSFNSSKKPWNVKAVFLVMDLMTSICNWQPCSFCRMETELPGDSARGGEFVTFSHACVSRTSVRMYIYGMFHGLPRLHANYPHDRVMWQLLLHLALHRRLKRYSGPRFYVSSVWRSRVWDFRLVKEPQAWKNRPLSKI